MKRRIILASASKRRSKILKECGIPHKVIVSNIPEKINYKKSAEFNVLYNARAKAAEVAARYKEGFVIGADTVVLLKSWIIGKPMTKKKAKSLLKAFSARTISVYTGLCVIDAKRKKSVSAAEVTKVRVKKLSWERVNEFVKIAEPHDKAGGFSIEGPGAFIFDNIDGSFYNVLGLSVMKLDELFRRLGVDLLE